MLTRSQAKRMRDPKNMNLRDIPNMTFRYRNITPTLSLIRRSPHLRIIKPIELPMLEDITEVVLLEFLDIQSYINCGFDKKYGLDYYFEKFQERLHHVTWELVCINQSFDLFKIWFKRTQYCICNTPWEARKRMFNKARTYGVYWLVKWLIEKECRMNHMGKDWMLRHAIYETNFYKDCNMAQFLIDNYSDYDPDVIELLDRELKERRVLPEFLTLPEPTRKKGKITPRVRIDILGIINSLDYYADILFPESHFSDFSNSNTDSSSVDSDSSDSDE